MPGGDIVAVACADARHQWVLTRDEQVWYFFSKLSLIEVPPASHRCT